MARNVRTADFAFCVETDRDGLIFRRRLGSLNQAVGASIFLVGLSAAFLVVSRFGFPIAERILVETTCCLLWIALGMSAARVIFGVERVRVSHEGLQYKLTALIPLLERQIPLSEIKALQSLSLPAYGGPQHVLELRTTGSTLRFGKGVAEVEARWLEVQIRNALRSLGAAIGVPFADDLAAQLDRFLCSSTTVRLPSDSTIQVRTEGNRTTLVKRGVLRITSLGILPVVGLVIAMIGFILLGLRGGHWTSALRPLGFAGYCLFAARRKLAALLAAFVVEDWTITPSEIEATRRVFGIAQRRSCDLLDPVRLELRRKPRKPSGSRMAIAQDDDSDDSYSILLTGSSARLRFTNLTEGEARFVAATLRGLIKRFVPAERLTRDLVCT